MGRGQEPSRTAQPATDVERFRAGRDTEGLRHFPGRGQPADVELIQWRKIRPGDDPVSQASALERQLNLRLQGINLILVFDSSSPVFDVSPFVMGLVSSRASNSGATF
jgi:hypothetical protein